MSGSANDIQRDLLHKIAAGDEAAFTSLYNQYWRKVYTFLVRMTKSHEIAEEFTGDIFTKLWIGRMQVNDIQDINAFLHRVSYNKAVDFFRLAAREKKLQRILASQTGHPQIANAADRLLDHEISAIFQKAIQELSSQRRKIFTLSREHGLSHEEIAERLNLSPLTVKATMSDALKSIRSFLRKNGIEGLVLLYLYVND